MRKNASQVYCAWREGKPLRKCNSIWTDGTGIYSYAFLFVWRGPDKRVEIDRTRHSVTTSIHQGAIFGALTRDGYLPAPPPPKPKFEQSAFFKEEGKR
jgi:hypothetical protein